jgi:3-methyladenine DNA glycosylase AlkD
VTVREVLAWLQATGTPETVEGMTRYGIPNDRAFGVPMGEMKRFAAGIGKDHALALELWQTGWYEARTVAVFLADPGQLTRRQMDAWVADMESWAICDTACFHLFDRTPHAWKAAPRWAASREELVRRAGYALIWALAAHDKTATDRAFLGCLEVIERGAGDGRNFVKKAIDMALRAIGKRNPSLHAAAIATARRLAGADDKTKAWIGRKTLRELESDTVRERIVRAGTKRGRRP